MPKRREFNADEDHFAVRDSLFDILRFISLLPAKSGDRFQSHTPLPFAETPFVDPTPRLIPAPALGCAHPSTAVPGLHG